MLALVDQSHQAPGVLLGVLRRGVDRVPAAVTVALRAEDGRPAVSAGRQYGPATLFGVADGALDLFVRVSCSTRGHRRAVWIARRARIA